MALRLASLWGNLKMVYFIPFQKYGETRPYYATNVDVYCHYILLLLRMVNEHVLMSPGCVT